jgi:patatin-like phospholipase/acyl hydrolase
LYRFRWLFDESIVREDHRIGEFWGGRRLGMGAYHVLSIDGGGIRGVLTARLLQRLEAERPGILRKVDLFAGTSTGGLLALGFAAGWTPEQALALYQKQGTRVFTDSSLDDLKDLGNAVGAEYDSCGLKEVLFEIFGDMRLGDLPKKVLISTFDLDNRPASTTKRRTWKPKFFHNYPGPDSDAHELVVDVGLRTSAAPSYFPIYQGYIDGGLVAGNPAMCALAQALDPGTGGQRLVDVALLSLSTGRYPRFLESENGDWGWVQWARPLIDLVMEGMSDVADYQCARVLGRRYHRLDPEFAEPISLDDLTRIPDLLDIAERVPLEHSVQWLSRYFR